MRVIRSSLALIVARSELIFDFCDSLLVTGVAILIALPLSLLCFLPGWAADCKEPPFIASGAMSNVLFILDNSGSMNEFAYKEQSGNFSSTAIQADECPTTWGCSGQPSTCNSKTSESTCRSVTPCTATTTPPLSCGAFPYTSNFTCTVTFKCKWVYMKVSGKWKWVCRRKYDSSTCICADDPCPAAGRWSASTSETGATITVDGSPGTGLRGSAFYGYVPTTKYYGYFDPDKTYKYSKTYHYFYTDSTCPAVVDYNGQGYRAVCATGSTGCDPNRFSGNWLNWLCTRRMDVAKKVLTGGRLGGDQDEYVLIGSPTDREYFKMFNDSGSSGVYYTPFHQGFVVQFYTSLDTAQRTAYNGAYVPLMAFWPATISGSQATIQGSITLGEQATYGNLGEDKNPSTGGQREENGSYYFAVKHSTVAQASPPAGIVQNMATKLRLGFMHFNFGEGPAEGATLGDEPYSGWFGYYDRWDIDGDGTVDVAPRYADAGRIVFRVGDTSTENSWQRKQNADGSYTTVPIYKMAKYMNELFGTTWTPLAETLREAMNYFRQQSPSYAWVDSAGTLKQNFYIGTASPDGSNWDPYVYGAETQTCAKSYIVYVTDGEPTQDNPCKSGCKQQNENTCTNNNDCPVPTAKPNFRFNGEGYLDDIAFKLWTEDNRTGIEDNQSVSLYTIFAFETLASNKERLQRAAIAGGFSDKNSDGEPGKPCPSGCTCNTWQDAYQCDYGPSVESGTYEWDADNNGSPDHYFDAQDGYMLETYITSIFAQVALGGAASAVATISQQTKEGDAIIRGAFNTVDPDNRTRYIWRGRLEVYWPDPYQQQYEFDHDANVGLFCSDMTSHHCGACTGEGVNRTCPDACCWDAAEKLKLIDPSTRTIFTYVKSRTDADTDPRQTPFTMNNWTYLQPLMREPHDSPVRDGVPDEQKTKALIQWTRGEVDSAGYPVGNPDTASGLWGNDPVNNPIHYRDRDGYLLGDIVYSTPVIVGAPPLASVTSRDKDLVRQSGETLTAYHDGVDAFWDFRNYWLENPSGTKYKGRPKIAYVGANDGMLHAFLIAQLKKDDDSWDYNCSAEGDYPACGSELWAYIPSNLLGELIALAQINYGDQNDTQSCKHRTMVDLSPRAWDVFIKSPGCADCGTGHESGPYPQCSSCTDKRCWRTIIIGGERGGGDMYFSVDVTDPLHPKVLWEYSVLQNLAVVRDGGAGGEGNMNITLPYWQRDFLHDYDDANDALCPAMTEGWPGEWPDGCFDQSPYLDVKTLPMSWTRAVLGRVRIPSDVRFWRYVDSAPAPTLAQTPVFNDCTNKRHIAFIGTGFQMFDGSTDFTKPQLLAIDVETGENYFQVLWALAVKARTAATPSLLPDRDLLDTRSDVFIPWAFGSPALVDVWSNNDLDTTPTETVTDLKGSFDEDGYVDRMYMGDMRGLLYRMGFNFMDYGNVNNANNKGVNIQFWPTKPIPQTGSESPTTCDLTNKFRGCRQPIQVTPAVSYDLASVASGTPKLRVLFGTGKFDKVTGGSDDKTDLTKMSFYNLADDIKSFCSTVAGETVCEALPTINPTAEVSIGSLQQSSPGPVGTYDVTIPAGEDVEKGFIISGTHFGLTFSDGACASESYEHYRSCTESAAATCTGETLTRVCGSPPKAGCDCKQAVRTNCCDWNVSGTPDRCQTITPCWSCIFDLSNDGERIIGDPLVAYGMVFFTTYVPTSSACAAGGHGWLYMLDYRCMPLDSGFNPVTNAFGLAVVHLPGYGAKVDLGAGMPSEPVMDSTGQYIFVQKSDATMVKIGAGGGDGSGGGGSSFRDTQFKGWDKR